MQISGKSILNSAEGIVREKKEDNPADSSAKQTENTTKASNTDHLSQTTMESKLLKLTAALSQIQNEYSREQTRQAYITKHPEQVNKDLEFNGSPLFPELNKGQQPEQLASQISNNLESLEHKLKSMQVEMENLFALNFDGSSPEIPKAGEHLDSTALKALDPDRVARLTQDN